MKLAEALILRADSWKRVLQIRERLNRVVRIQEDEEPAQNPQELLAEHDRALETFTDMVKRINRTNSATPFDATRTLTDVLADRDALQQERISLAAVINAASAQNFRYSRSEIKYVTTVNVAELQKRADDLARQHRELDTAIQALNWSVDLVE